MSQPQSTQSHLLQEAPAAENASPVTCLGQLVVKASAVTLWRQMDKVEIRERESIYADITVRCKLPVVVVVLARCA
jgi:hypothetical protein